MTIVHYQGGLILNVFHQIEPASTDRLLACFSLAIDEAKLVRSLNQMKDQVSKVGANTPFSERLIFLNRKITNLEAKLADVRKQANQR